MRNGRPVGGEGFAELAPPADRAHDKVDFAAVGNRLRREAADDRLDVLLRGQERVRRVDPLGRDRADDAGDARLAVDLEVKRPRAAVPSVHWRKEDLHLRMLAPLAVLAGGDPPHRHGGNRRT